MNVDDYENQPSKVGDYARTWARKAGRIVESALGSMPGGRREVIAVEANGPEVYVSLGRGVEIVFKQESPGSREERCVALRMDLRGRGIMRSLTDAAEDSGL